MKIKEKMTKVKIWVKEHKGIIIKTGLAAVATGIGAILVKVICNHSEKQEEVQEEFDGGRECTMRFIVNDTQEVLGEVPCYESYAKENIEMFEDFQKDN